MLAPIFLLAPGRSFTSVFSVMLGEHPELFTVPETNLTLSTTVGEWLAATSGMRRPLQRAGLLRAIAYLETGTESTATVLQAQQWLMANSTMPVAELYQMLRNSVAPRGLVEKSPTSVNSPENLLRMMELAPDAKFIHVTRHPYSNCQSIMNTDWYRAGLEHGSQESWDYRSAQPVFDPQFYWLATHQRIVEFQSHVAPERWLRLRGEDVLSSPETVLADICRWLGISEESKAIAQMMQPENSPFARLGPRMAAGGNDPSFLNNPSLRPYQAPACPLEGALPWRTDGETFVKETRQLAEAFGYLHEVPKSKRTSRPIEDRKIVRIEPDGDGSPMPHANSLDNSLCGVPPLRDLASIDHVPWPTFGGINFGAYTGETCAVAVYEGPREPAIAAFDLNTGQRIWQTPLDVMEQTRDLPGRWVGGVLMAKLTFEDGTTERRIYAGNRKEMVCLSDSGKIYWRKSAEEILGAPNESLGTPRCIRISSDNKVFYFTGRGNLVKFDPVTGQSEDVYRLDDQAVLNGQLTPGRFEVTQSVILVGDYVYVQAKFDPDHKDQIKESSPVTLLKIKVTNTSDGKFERLADVDTLGEAADRLQVAVVGNGLQGGSPSGMIRADGVPVIIANGHQVSGGFGVRAVADEADQLREQWVMPIPDQADPIITAAPANDPVTGLYMCTTKESFYIVRDAANRTGTISPDVTIPARHLLAPEYFSKSIAAELSSPISLAREPGATNFVCYVGLSVLTSEAADPFSVLTAVEVQVNEDNIKVAPLWTGSLAQDEYGTPIPSPRSYAQPAMFRYQDGNVTRTGIVMGTIRNGVSIFK